MSEDGEAYRVEDGQNDGSWLGKIDDETYLELAELAGIVTVGIFVISAASRAHQNLSLIVVLSLIFLELTFIREAISEVSADE